MNLGYFNHRHFIAQDRWERWSFVRNWWRIYRSDPYWVPPYYPTLRWALDPGRNPHLSRLSPTFVYSEALPGRGRKPRAQFDLSSSLIEDPVSAGIALKDPRRNDQTAYLALLHCVNDVETLKYLLTFLAELLQKQGYRRIITPTGLSPHLGTGMLQDHWNEIPPLHTPYSPPYLPEVATLVFRPRSRSQLYHLAVPSEPVPVTSTKAELVPLEPARLEADLLPLLQAACPSWLDFAPPDSLEAHFIQRWLGPWPLHGWLAQIDTEPVGFILLQPDLAPRLRQARGGRMPWWCLWLKFTGLWPVSQGRVLYAAVLPAWRRQGLGRQLFQQAIRFAQQQGWRSLSIGPFPATAPGSRFLEQLGAEPRQTYFLYQAEL